MFKLISKMGCISAKPIKHPKKPLPTIPNNSNANNEQQQNGVDFNQQQQQIDDKQQQQQQQNPYLKASSNRTNSISLKMNNNNNNSICESNNNNNDNNNRPLPITIIGGSGKLSGNKKSIFSISPSSSLPSTTVTTTTTTTTISTASNLPLSSSSSVQPNSRKESLALQPFNRTLPIPMNNINENTSISSYNNNNNNNSHLLQQQQHQQQQSNSNNPKIVIALYAYESRDDGELSFEKNEKLVILDDTEPDWWLAYKLTQPDRKGYIPMNFVVSNVIETEEWFFSKISRREAERLLLFGEFPRGTFLIRNSEQDPGICEDFFLWFRLFCYQFCFC